MTDTLAPPVADNFIIRRLADRCWIAELRRGGWTIRKTSSSYCPRQAASGHQGPRKEPLRFAGAFGMEAGRDVFIPLEELLAPCDATSRYPVLRQGNSHDWCHAGGEALLQGRVARCAQCMTTRPSDPSLAFFEDRGPGSRAATERCGTCRYNLVAHTPETMGRPHMRKIQPHDFTPFGPWDTDGFYCGCRGWD